LCFTINMFNCLYIDELLRWAEHMEFDYIHWNMLHDPKHFNVSYMPQPVKDLFTDSLQRRQTFDRKYNREVSSLVQFIEQQTPGCTSEEILSVVDRTDRFRSQNISELYPELYQALQDGKT